MIKKIKDLCTKDLNRFNVVKENYKLITILLLVFNILELVFQWTGKNSLFFIILPIIIHTLIFLISSSKDNIKYCWKIYLFNIMMLIIMLINYFIIAFIKSFEWFNATGYFTLIFIIDFIIISLEIPLYFNRKVHKALEDLYCYIPSEYIINDKTEEIERGSLKLGKDIHTGKYHYIPPKDRFLHTLILGATGTGKTSQVIIPAIYHDIYEYPEAGVIVIEPKQDLAEKVWAMGVDSKRDVIYFNPVLPDCPYFNPLFGDESEVLENMATTFTMLNPDAPIFFQNVSEDLIKKAIKVIKRMYGNDATLLDLQTLIFNTDGEGSNIISAFQVFCETEKRKNPYINPDIITENQAIASWFIHDYFSGSSGGKNGTKTYEHCTGIRAQVSKLCSNKYLRKVLNPPKGVKNGLDFEYALANGQIITIATAQGALRDLGSYLGYFIIFQLQSSVFRRKGNENTRRPCNLYIDECQKYLNPGFGDMLTQARSYRVASVLAIQNKALLGINAGRNARAFIDLITTNCRNVVIYPGGNIEDAEYYSKQFGEIMKKEMQKGITVQKKGIFSVIPSGMSEQTRYTEKLESRFSPTDIMFRPFGQVTVSYIKNNSIQIPVVLEVEYIDKNLNAYLDSMIIKYNQEQENKALYLNRENVKKDIKTNTINDEKENSKSNSEETPKVDDIDAPSFINSDSKDNSIDNVEQEQEQEEDDDEF